MRSSFQLPLCRKGGPTAFGIERRDPTNVFCICREFVAKRDEFMLVQ